VKPAPFDYLAPRSLDEALEILATQGHDAKILAGGQSLIPVLNFRLAQPALLVDINALAELDFLRPESDGGLTIGALVRHRRLERESEVARRVPLLAEAVPFVAHPQIRARGTFGGSLAHADPAAEFPAVAIALGARLRLQRRGGDRWVEARAFFTGLFATALEPGELLTEVRFPPNPERAGAAFLEVSRRHGDYAQAGIAARVVLDAEGLCREARLVFLSVGEGPVDTARAAAGLVGAPLDQGAIAEAARIAATEEIDPVGDIHASADFKRHLVGVLTARALRLARARGSRAA
jgi:aerobic carbon-monoxide dehydrogenase medium subunit